MRRAHRGRACAAGALASMLGLVLAVGCGKESEVEQSGGPEPATGEVAPTEGGAQPTPSVALMGCALRPTEKGRDLGFAPAPGDVSERGGGGSGRIGARAKGEKGWGAGAPSSGYRRAPSKAILRIGQPVVTGDMPRELVRRVLRQYSARLRYCYEKALLTQPGLKGKILAKFVIDSTGTVDHVSVDGFDSKLDTCVATALRAMRFPASDGGGIVQVRAPIVFSLREPAPDRPTAKPTVAAEPPAQVNPDAQPPVPDMAALVVTLRSKLSPVRECYERALETAPGLDGALHVDLSIAADGSIAEARPSAAPPSLSGGDVDTCAIEALRALTLPDWKGGATTVTCTFLFSPTETDFQDTGAGGGEGAAPAGAPASDTQP